MGHHGPFRAPEIKIYHNMQAEIDDLRGFIDRLVPNYTILDTPYAWAAADGNVISDRYRKQLIASKRTWAVELYTIPLYMKYQNVQIPST